MTPRGLLSSPMQRVLKVHLPLEYPFVYRINASNNDSPLTGFLYEIWKLIANKLRAQGYTIQETVGAPKDTEYWIDAIYRKKFDVVVTPAIQTVKRKEKINISSTIFITYFSLIERDTQNSWFQVIVQLLFYELIPLFLVLCIVGLLIGYIMYRLSKKYTKESYFSYSLYNIINLFGTSSNISSYLIKKNINKLGRSAKGSYGSWYWWCIFIFIASIAVIVSAFTRSYITTRMVQENVNTGNRINAQNISSKVILARKGSTSGAIVANIAKRVDYRLEPMAQLVQDFNKPSGQKYDAIVMQTYDANQTQNKFPNLVESPIDLGASPVGILLTKRADMKEAVDIINDHIDTLMSSRELYDVCKKYMTDPNDAACIA